MPHKIDYLVKNDYLSVLIYDGIDEVLKELELYGSLVSKNSYCIVFDTVVAKMDSGFSKDRPWNKKNSPQSAKEKFLKTNKNFIIDYSIDKKLLLSMAPGGFLKKIK